MLYMFTFLVLSEVLAMPRQVFAVGVETRLPVVVVAIVWKVDVNTAAAVGNAAIGDTAVGDTTAAGCGKSSGMAVYRQIIGSEGGCFRTTLSCKGIVLSDWIMQLSHPQRHAPA